MDTTKAHSSYSEIGDRRSLAFTLASITRIPENVLRGNGPRELTEQFGVARIMTWAADRETSKPDDRGYSLVGLFGVSLDERYGDEEGRAFRRLQEPAVIHRSSHSDGRVGQG